jgi:threonine aldolase
MKSFASDNNAGACPEMIEALSRANDGHVIAYGDDHFTERTREKFKEIFGHDAESFFVFNGTAANVLSIKALTNSYNAVLCAETAHIYTDECGAPESLTGCKLLPISTTDGKLTPELISKFLGGRGDQHHVQPHVISITQSTELGTVYSLSELKSLTQFAHSQNLFVHMDGARLSNAAAYLNCTLREVSTDVGIDVLSFGGTKNGLFGGEAVVFLNKKMAPDFKYYRKQFMQLSSKMRFIAVQFEALLTNDLWKRNAAHANRMAHRLFSGIKEIKSVKVCYPVQSNGVFVQIPKDKIKILQEKFFFYVWNEGRSEVRWMTSFDTTEIDVDNFLKDLKAVLV